MKYKHVLGVFLVALVAAPCYGGVLDKLKVPDVDKALQTVKDKLDVKKTADASAGATVDATASAGAQAVLSVPSVDVEITKEPVVTLTDAPCKNICKDKCKVDVQKVCKDVPVVTKECTPAKKTLTKKVCGKKCTLVTESPKYVKKVSPATPNVDTPPATPEQPPATPEQPPATPEQPPSTPEQPPATPEQPPATPEVPNPSKPPVAQPENPNPSAPPMDQPNPPRPPLADFEQPNPSRPPTAAVARAQEAGLPALDTDLASDETDASPTEDADLAGNSDGEGAMVVDLAGEDATSENEAETGLARRLHGLLGLKGHVVHKKVEAAVVSKIVKALPVPSCDEVCDEVNFDVPDLHCQDVTHQVQHCDFVPNETCEKECVCIPQKTVSVNLPKKGIRISKDDNSLHIGSKAD